jgi:hypothetical protein
MRDHHPKTAHAPASARLSGGLPDLNRTWKRHLCVIWLERMILSILICGIIAVIIFPASMIA